MALDRVVVDDVAFGGVQGSLFGSQIVGHAVVGDPAGEGVFG